MRTGPLVALASLASASLAAGAVAIVGRPEAPAPRAPGGPAAPSGDAEALRRRLDDLEGRVEELAAALAAARAETAAAREAARAEADALRAALPAAGGKADPAATLIAGYTGDPAAAPAREPGLDAFAREVSSAMRKGMEEEFRRLADLITDPTPEALDLRRRQLRMFASAIGVQAGLDQAQIGTLERVLGDSEEQARERLRPLLVGVDDPRKLDYPGIRKVTDDTFAAQDAEFDKEFPKEKSDRLKRQMEPVRNLFGAMLDELGKEAAAEAPK
jgi:hypothetical protein